MEKRISTIYLLLILGIVLIFAGYINFLGKNFYFPEEPQLPERPESSDFKDFKKFSSVEEFKNYLQKGELLSLPDTRLVAREDVAFEAQALGFPKGEGTVPQRYSETNVQVVGIDEPDIVKTDGKNIYFSSSRSFYPRRFVEILPPQIKGETKIVKAFPPPDLKVESKIDKAGDLLLNNNILMVFSGNKIYGFDISDEKSPYKKWTMELKNNTRVVGARIYNDKVYLITGININSYRPCPIEPLSVGGEPVSVKCTDIYHPIFNFPVDITYTAFVIDPLSGEIEKTVSFVGSSGQSLVYMSKNTIYTAYPFSESLIEFYYNFLKEEAKDIIPAYLFEKLNKLISYDISEASKMTEFQIIFQGFYNSLSDDERLKLENELNNRMNDYYKSHKRDLTKTAIVKIGLPDFKILAFGKVPGSPLNQFSLDEYQDYLRVAVTIGGRWLGIFGQRTEPSNDVYVLDKNLEIKGKVQELAEGERIYSVRFIEDKGYVVTFKQVDPFFVLDLSNPENPALKGELKIPGYSSYLHPITKDKILGVGKEGANVKLSLFDVSNPSLPKETAKYTLKEYWSDVLNTHHAFLLDKKHQIFFLPGSRGGYVFSYKNNSLKLEKAVSNINPRRAVYIDDYLYIISDNEIIVLRETDWQKVNELEF